MAGYNNWPYIINLGNSIIGVALLAMPFCFKQCGILLSMLILLFCTWLTLTSSQLLMKAGITSRRRSYEFLAYHTHGATGKLVTEVGMIGMQLGTLIAQIVVTGDIGPAIISKYIGIQNTSGLRTSLIILLCMSVGLPLGLLKDLQAISRASTVCITFYCVFVLYILYLSIPALYSGEWYQSVYFWRPEGLFQCLPILSFSFGCQTQLFLVYDALPEPSFKTMSSVISSAVNLCAVAYLLVGFFGYIAFFSGNIPGDIVAVFPSTFFADMMKLCFVFSIVITFPVIIFPCRASIYTLLFAKKLKSHEDVLESDTYISENLFKAITVCIVLCSMIAGILIPNVEFILGMNGAVTGTLICYIFPAMFFLKVMGTKPDGKTVAKVVLWLGVTILLVSTYATLSSHDKAHVHEERGIAPPDNLIGIVDGQIEKPVVHDTQGDNNNKELNVVDAKRQEPPVPHPPDSVLKVEGEKMVDKRDADLKNASIRSNVKDGVGGVDGSKDGHKNVGSEVKKKDLEQLQQQQQGQGAQQQFHSLQHQPVSGQQGLQKQQQPQLKQLQPQVARNVLQQDLGGIGAKQLPLYSGNLQNQPLYHKQQQNLPNQSVNVQLLRQQLVTQQQLPNREVNLEQNQTIQQQNQQISQQQQQQQQIDGKDLGRAKRDTGEIDIEKHDHLKMVNSLMSDKNVEKTQNDVPHAKELYKVDDQKNVVQNSRDKNIPAYEKDHKTAKDPVRDKLMAAQDIIKNGDGKNDGKNDEMKRR